MHTEMIRVGGKKFKTLKWLLRPGLRAVFIGVNPALPSVQAGHYYQGRQGRRFWSRIQEYSIVGPLPEGTEDRAAFAQGLGFADLVRRPTASARELTNDEIEKGAANLVRRLKALPDRPLIVFVYAKAAEKAEAALGAAGFATFRLPGPYAKKEVAASRMRSLGVRLRQDSINATSASKPRAMAAKAVDVAARRGRTSPAQVGSDEAGPSSDVRLVEAAQPVVEFTSPDIVPAELLSSVLNSLNPRRVILFGSHARGTAEPDSDWDLLVVVDDDVPAERVGWRALHEARRGFRGAVDLIPCRESTFRERVDVVGSLPWIAANEGVIVFERGETA